MAVDGKVYTAKQTVDYAVDAEYGTYSRPFIIDLGEATGIETLDDLTHSQLSNYYDLQGRKIANSQFVNRKSSKGVYIVNGQKIVK